jgi:hypothetical protein
MMVNEIVYNLEYRDEDGKHSIPLKIDFIAKNRIDEFIAYLEKIREIKFLWDMISDFSTEIGELKTIRSEGYKARIEELQKGIKEAQIKIQDAWCGGDIIQERQKIISAILTQNGIEKKELYDYKWWDEHTRPSDIIDFMQKAIFMDSDMGEKKNPIIM